jgi:hypothetical protein
LLTKFFEFMTGCSLLIATAAASGVGRNGETIRSDVVV